MTLSNRAHGFLACIAGALSVFAFAPFNQPIFALISAASLYILCYTTRPFLLGWCFGLGYFGAGVSWVFVSIHYHGGMGIIAAALMTFLFTAGLGMLFALQIGLYRQLFKPHSALGFIAVWVVFEWVRSWLFTGFPWLLTGYAFIDTPLAQWAPIGGVWLVSLMAISVAVLTAEATLRRRPSLLILPLSIFVLSGFIPNDWVKKTEETRSITLIQPNLAQQTKWDVEQVDRHIKQLINLTAMAPATQLIIWPETAIPKLVSTAKAQLTPLTRLLDAQNTVLISGFPRRVFSESSNRALYHNAIGTLNGPEPLTVYDKQRLVPFGEYLPFEHQLRNLIAFFALPMSNFSLPKGTQQGLNAQGLNIASAICYEIAYPELVRHQTRNASVILTVSNDTWFGGSHGPDQHFEIARMRALENGRPVIRSTNDGITGFIDHEGQVISTAPRFTEAMLTADLTMVTGQTPYQRVGISLTLLMATLMLTIALLRARSFKQYTKTGRAGL